MEDAIVDLETFSSADGLLGNKSPDSFLRSRCGDRSLLRVFCAELLGTFILIAFGQGVVAQTVLSSTAPGCGASSSTAGSYLAINFGWGGGVFFGVLVSIGVSGAHINPAVTVALAALGRFPARRVLPYVAAQLLGAFVASGVVLLEYQDALDEFGRVCCDGSPYDIVSVHNVTGRCNAAAIWTTFPQQYLSLSRGFFDQVLGTALLLIGVMAIGDDLQRAPDRAASSFVKAASVASLVTIIGMSFGVNTGYAINPARDFGPRCFLALATPFGSAVFRPVGTDYAWWWVPLVAPLFGAILGALTYQGLVGAWVPPVSPRSTELGLAPEADRYESDAMHMHGGRWRLRSAGSMASETSSGWAHQG